MSHLLRAAIVTPIARAMRYCGQAPRVGLFSSILHEAIVRLFVASGRFACLATRRFRSCRATGSPPRIGGAAGSSAGASGGAGHRQRQRQRRRRQQRARGAAAARGRAAAAAARGTRQRRRQRAGGSAGAVPFPTQACIDRANGLLAQMTLDEKVAQTIQAERAQITNAQVTQFGVGSIYSQGGSAPEPEHAGRLGDDDQRLPRGLAREPPQDPDHLRARQRPRPGPGRERDRVPAQHRPGRDRRRRRWSRRSPASPPTSRRASAPTSRSRPSSRSRATSAGGGRTRRSRRRPTSRRRWASRWSRGCSSRRAERRSRSSRTSKHYLGDGGTANGVTGGPVTGDEAALRALHLEPYRAAVAARVGSVMLSYNTWQGVEMHINKPMITDVLKGELGFGGFVVTDYNGCFQVGPVRRQRRPGRVPQRGRGHVHDLRRRHSVPQPVGSGTTILSTIRELVNEQHGADGAPRRRRPPHPGREVRDGPVRQRRRRSIRRRRAGSDRPSTGWWRGARCRSRWSC